MTEAEATAEALELFSALEERDMLSFKEKNNLKKAVESTDAKMRVFLAAAIKLFKDEVNKQKKAAGETPAFSGIREYLNEAHGTQPEQELMETIGVMIACYNN